LGSFSTPAFNREEPARKFAVIEQRGAQNQGVWIFHGVWSSLGRLVGSGQLEGQLAGLADVDTKVLAPAAFGARVQARGGAADDRLKRVLTSFSPTFPGFYLYYPSRHDQPTKLKALIEYTRRRTS
jgi:hypothetical protein